MKPFLPVTGMGVPAFEEYSDAILPWGPIASPTVNLKIIAPAFMSGIDGMIKEARVAFMEVRKMGATAARCEGVEEWWGKNLGGLIASCVATGVTVAGIRGKVSGKSGDVEGMVVEFVEVGKRYHDWWVVPKIS
jgi:hypothetical protein